MSPSVCRFRVMTPSCRAGFTLTVLEEYEQPLLAASIFLDVLNVSLFFLKIFSCEER